MKASRKTQRHRAHRVRQVHDGGFPQNFRDLTLIAGTSGDYAALVVNADSDVENMADLLAKFEADPNAPVIGRQSLQGFFIGVLPGAGATIASFRGYAVERNIATKDDQAEFGKGSIKGLAAPESANNAACTGSFVPLLTLGIPGSGTTATLLGALKFADYPLPPLLIGFILGKMLEENFSRSMQLYDGLGFIRERPMTLALLVVAARLIVLPGYQSRRARARGEHVADDD